MHYTKTRPAVILTDASVPSHEFSPPFHFRRAKSSEIFDNHDTSITLFGAGWCMTLRELQDSCGRYHQTGIKIVIAYLVFSMPMHVIMLLIHVATLLSQFALKMEVSA